MTSPELDPDAQGAIERALEAVRSAADREGAGDPEARSLYDAALPVVDSVLRIAPSNPLLLLARAIVLDKQQRGDEALAVLSRAIAEDPRAGPLRTARGRMFERAGRLDEALADYAAAAELAPEVAYVHRDLGDVWLALGDRSRAMEAYEAALALDPGYIDVYRIRAAESLVHGRAEDAIHDYEQVLALEPSAAGYRELGDAHAAAGHTREAIEAFTDAIRLDSGLPDAYLGRALARAAQGEQEAAFDDFTTALAIAPDTVKALRGRAEAALALGRVADAVEDVDRAIALGYGGPDVRYQRAWALSGTERIEEALEDLAVAIEGDPGATDAYRLRASIYHRLGQHDLALSDYESVIALEPGGIDGYVGRADELVALGDPAKALWDYDRAIDLDAERIDAHAGRIFARLLHGDQLASRQLPGHARHAYLHALDGVGEGLDVAPTEPAFHVYKCGGLRLLGAYDRAIEAAQAGIDIVAPSPASLSALHREAGDSLRLWGESEHRPDKLEAGLVRLAQAEDHCEGDVEPIIFELQGHALLELERPREALERFAPAIERAADPTPSIIGTAKAHLLLDDLDDATEFLGRVLEPAAADSVWYVWAQAGRAVASKRRGDEDNATAQRSAALGTRDSISSRLVYARALIYYDAFEDAERELLAAIELDPRSAGAKNTLAWLYVDRMASPERLETAQRLAADAVNLEDSSDFERANCLDTAGWIAHQRGSHLEAVHHLREAVSLESHQLLFFTHLHAAEIALEIPAERQTTR